MAFPLPTSSNSSTPIDRSGKLMELTPMPTILVRVSLICHHLHGLLLHFLPKKLASFLFPSWLITLPPPSAVAAASKLLDPVASDSPFVAPSFTPRALARLQARPGTMDQSSTELKRVFQMFDRNGDGRITKQELNESLGNLGIYIPEEELGAMIEKIDVNGDGCVDIEEFGTLYQSIMDERDEEEDMREAFNVFDQNGDGFITVEELRSVLASLGLKQGRTVEDCRKMISKVDVDGDGMVDFKEFKQMMKGGGFAALS